MILTDATLLAEIEAFIEEHEIKPSRFGLDAMGDGALVFQLRTGRRSLRLKSAERVLAHISQKRSELSLTTKA
ncbi:hypothetical protein [uncultured Sphingomonas sp.]|uniref:hypothetical protein n=1 Tax=uncultured Sphingomonas sp. TaxID=158754 RepID=UPI00260E074C|nr:hypothetical protein [uncultured Sphingomonas sp.]